MWPGPYIDSVITARPVANFFGGDILEPVFDWLYYPIDWNTNNFGNQFAPGLYSCVMIWMRYLCSVILCSAGPRPGTGFIRPAAI